MSTVLPGDATDLASSGQRRPSTAAHCQHFIDKTGRKKIDEKNCYGRSILVFKNARPSRHTFKLPRNESKIFTEVYCVKKSTPRAALCSPLI